MQRRMHTARLFRRPLALLVATITAAGLTVAGAPAIGAADDSGAPPAFTYLVRFVDGSDARAEASRLRQSGAAVSAVWEHVFPGIAVTLPEAAAEALARSPRVESVEADGPVTVAAAQADPPWGLDRSDQRYLPLSASYTYPEGAATVRAYVVDTGILATHAEFSGRLDPGYTTIADGLGTSDCAGHGTHVAGTLAGTTYGVAKTARLTAVRVLDCSGSGTWSDVISGLDWIVADHGSGVPAVANMSLSGGANSTVDTAVQRVINDGVTLVVAAGNANSDACKTSPARATNALTVGATDSADLRASFSNFGSCLDLFAPGVDILSSYASSPTETRLMSGTSMASPHVAGAAALTLAANPTLTPAQVASKLITAATPGLITDPGKFSPNRLLFMGTDSASSVTQTAPTAPTAVSASALKRGAKVSWVLGSSGNSPLTKQTVWAYQGATRLGSVDVSASATSVSLSGLTAGVSYSFTVTATNAIGTSPESAPSNTITALR